MLSLLVVALLVCAALAKRSKRAIANDVSLLLIALLPPIVGNLVLTASSDWFVSQIGCYLYYLGIDWSVISVLRFSCVYCSIPYMRTKGRLVANILVALDVVQLLLNPIFGHAFITVPTIVDGAIYYSMIPMIGQQIHRAIAYGVFFVALGIVAYKTITASRIYVERYLVLLICMVVCGLWETYYILSGAPIDRSMISFGIYGLLVYYFAIHYRPMRLLDRMLARVVEGMSTAVFFFDVSGKCIYSNDLAHNMVRLGTKDDIPEDISPLICKAIGGWGGDFNEDWSKQIRVGQGSEVRYLDVSMQQVLDDQDRPIGASLVVRDTTEEERRLQRERYLASHDQLTGIYNQRFLFEQARALIDENPDVDYVVAAFDIKDFKIINDVYSKEYGDEILKTLASQIGKYARADTVYGRISGDKFGAIMRKDGLSIEAIDDLLGSFGERVTRYPVVVHMGLYEVVERNLLVSVMFDRAFMAIMTIKNDFNRLVAVYDNAMRDDLVWNQMISQQLEQALRDGQIQPYLQPMVDAEGRVEGAEVLVRWIHPEEGVLSPARFIPVFENNGMIATLDMFMWEQACLILNDWAKQGIDLFLSVNISPKDFYFIDVYETIKEIVQKHNVDPSKLRLEITETVMMTDIENRLRIIEELRSDGFLVEMDDFGSGYSSLNMLKDIPVDVLKIDMTFLYKTKDAMKAQTILQTIINLSGQLGIPSVTEGVETVDQLTMLVNMGCQLFQGYYFAKPMPRDEFEKRYKAA